MWFHQKRFLRKKFPDWNSTSNLYFYQRKFQWDGASIDLTWLDLTLISLEQLTKLKWYRVAQVARISPEEANWTNEPLKQPLTTHLRVRVIVSRNQQQEFHTLLAIIISYQTFLTKLSLPNFSYPTFQNYPVKNYATIYSFPA
jgi:hypothetical protein